MTTIQLTLGETKVVDMPSHVLDRTGYASFVVAGLDFDQYTQWSVIGARKSEIIKENENINKLGDDCCRVYVLDDQYTPEGESRIINVSVIGTDATTKEQVEAKAILTVNIHTQPALKDFHIVSVDFPEVIIVHADGSTTPEIMEASVTINEEIGTISAPKYSAYITVNTQGNYSIAETYKMAPKVDNSKIFYDDVSDSVHRGITHYLTDGREFLEGSLDFDVFRHAEKGEPDYYHIMGKKFLVHKE